jgi:hypothetical protein
MAVKLSPASYEFAQQRVKEGYYVIDNRDDWSEHEPTAAEQNEFIASRGWGEYAKWHLGVDDEQKPDKKARYRFPYGDFRDVHRCGILAAESRAAQNEYHDIEGAAAHLHGMLEALAAVRT